MPRKAAVSNTKRSEKVQLERTIAENLITLQKVNTDLAEKFDSLSKQISALLKLFENAARTFASVQVSQPQAQVTQKDKEFLDKIDRLLDQNKTIAKGLTLMEEKFKDKVYGSQVPAQSQNQDISSMLENRDDFLEDKVKYPSSGKSMPR